MRYNHRLTLYLFPIFFFFICACKPSFSQQVTWGFPIGGAGTDHGQTLYKDANGNIYNSGAFSGANIDFDPSANDAIRSSNGLEDGYVVKYTPAGIFSLCITIGGSGLDKINAVATDQGGNIYICGFFRGSSVDFDPSPATAYLSSNGDVGGDPGYGGDIFVAKYSSTGQYLWAFNIGGGTLGDNGLAIKTDITGAVIVGGYFRQTIDFDPSGSVFNLDANNGTAFLAKFSTNGQLQWAFNFGAGGTVDNTIFDLKIDASNSIYITGFFQGSNIDFDPSAGVANLSAAGNFEAFLAKYNSSGQYQFAFKIGGTGLDTGRGITFDDSGNIYVLGDFNGSNIDFDPSPASALLSSNGGSDIFVAKYSSTGQYLWAFNAGSGGGEIGWKIATDNESIFITGGFSGTADFNPGPGTDNLVTNGGADIFLAKYDLNGNYKCAFSVGSTGNDNGLDIVIGDNQQFYLTGSFQGLNVDFSPSQATYYVNSAGNTDSYVMKYLWPPNTQPVGSATGNSICDGTGTAQLTFTATAGTSPFTLQYTDGVNTYIQTNVLSGVPFNVQNFPGVTTNYTISMIQDAVRCSPQNNNPLIATIIVGNGQVRTRVDTTVCKSTSVQLVTTGAQTYSWSPATYLSATNIASPVATPDVPMQYIVTGTTASGCILKDTVNIGIHPIPVITISNDTAICRNSSVQLFVAGGQSYSWSPTATLTNPGTSSPTATPSVNIMYYVTITDINACTGRDSVFVSIRPDAVFAVNGPVNVCINDSIQLNASGGDIYSWQPSAGLSNASVASPKASPQNTTIYSVTITESVCNQSAILSTVVNALPLPVVAANKSNDIDCSVGNATLSASGASVYLWSPSAFLNNPSASSPVASPIITTDFIVQGTDLNGCINYDTVTVNVTGDNKGGYLMATGFTPNNDGLNDCYGIKYWGIIQEIDFSIYNRWGEKVFHTTNPNVCWDGKIKGVPQDSNVFVYVIKARTSCEAAVFRKGTFTLIR